jgi:FKBP-type peptidyl-prolyl cis-trans isomerase FklB
MLASGSALAQDVTSEKGKLSYAVGWNLGSDIKRGETEFDIESVITAIRDVVSENEPKVSPEEMKTLLIALGEEVRAKQVERIRQLAEENQVKSEEWLEANKSKTGIKALSSGVQYRIIEEGEGPRPTMDSTFMLHYRGTKMDGREFDSSFARGTPVEYTFERIMKGWQEVLPMMKVGSTYQVFIPPELAFGQEGFVDPQRNIMIVEPNEALMFDLKLVEIVK